MNRLPRWVVLSPHLDDAPLSIGGLIAALKSLARVEVWTIFCGATFQGPYSEVAMWLHDSSGGATGSRLSWQRQREDRGACKQLGAKSKHYPFKDAAYRKTEGGDFMYATSQPATWHRNDDRMIADLTKVLSRDLDESDIVLAPLGLGKHVDHIITRLAAEDAKIPGLLYYPDVPYIALFKEHVPAATEGLRAFEYSLTPDQIGAWIAAVKCYTSQLPMLERAAGPMPTLIREYASAGLHLYRSSSATQIYLGDIGFFRFDGVAVG